MKSFDKFQYERTDLHELKIGQYARGAANKVKTALQRRSNTITPKGAMGAKMRRSPNLRRQAIEQQRTDAQKSINKNPNLRVGEPIKTNNRTGQSSQANANKVTAITKYNPTDKKVKKFKPKSGIQRIMDRTKKNLKDKAESQTGRAVGRAAAGAAKEVFGYKPDRERTDTGQGGMGTALRQMTGIGKAAVRGAVDAPAERINPKQRKTLGGKLLALGKERAQTKVGITPTARTLQGRKLTGGTSRKTDRERTDQIATSVAKSDQKVTGGKSDFQQRVSSAKQYVRSAPTRNTQLTDRSDDELSKTKDPGNLKQFTNRMKKNTDSQGRRTIDSMNPDEKAKAGITGGSTTGGSTEGSGGANTNNTVVTTGNRRSTDKPENPEPVRRAARTGTVQRSFLGTKEFQDATKKPEENKNEKKKVIQKKITNLNASVEEPMNLSKILEANRIKQQQKINELPNRGQMRTDSQMQQDKLRNQALKKASVNAVANNESYSHWREEFLWEVDKKYPEKMKEIKPMSGKNNITINPEDETSKYKRGY
tara:strand:- start:6 stop:1619 length:1614 start_codon:yes stop_codon:yes gene_type:complete